MNPSLAIRKSATIINFPTSAVRSKSALERLMDDAVSTDDPQLNARNREIVRRIQEILKSAQEVAS